MLNEMKQREERRRGGGGRREEEPSGEDSPDERRLGDFGILGELGSWPEEEGTWWRRAEEVRGERGKGKEKGEIREEERVRWSCRPGGQGLNEKKKINMDQRNLREKFHRFRDVGRGPVTEQPPRALDLRAPVQQAIRNKGVM